MSINSTRNTMGLVKRALSTKSNTWVRNPSWPACVAASGSNKIVGLYAVWPGDTVGNGGNFFAMVATGAYTINYGDGTTTNYATGVTAYYEFNYNNAALAGTNAPVTFTDAGDLVTRTSHGYINGMTVRFYNIVSTTGITEAQQYYVINATTNTFQISSTAGGSAVALTTDGSATLLPYKIATVTITPQAANNLVVVSFNVKHNQSTLADGYSTGWLDIAIAGANITTLTIGAAAATIRHFYLENVSINQLGTILSFANLFYNCFSLKNISIDNSISSVTDMSNMFNQCYSLTSVRLFNTAAVTSMSNLFGQCFSLTSVPLFNTISVTNMSNMFNTCSSLTSVPLFNTISVTNMSAMFSGCTSLATIPLFNTISVTDMNNMFSGCTSLATIPLLNTALVSNMSAMFNSCTSLTNLPLLNTISVINMSSMFNLCYSLTSVPLFNTAAVTNMSSMFNQCYSLTSVPLFNTALVSNMGAMFSSCSSLATIPLFNTAAVTTMQSMFSGCNNLTSLPALVTTAITAATGFTNMFSNCSSLARIQAKNFRFTFSVASCKLSATALNEIYTNLPTVATQTLTVTGNYGTLTDTITTAITKGWTVAG